MREGTESREGQSRHRRMLGVVLKSSDMGCCALQCETVDPVDVEALAATVKKAVTSYGSPAFSKMIKACMAQDLSWKVCS